MLQAQENAGDSPNILVVEDERDIAELIALHLRDQHFEAEIATDGNTGLERALQKEWDLIILDLRLPGKDGLDICREVRRSSRYTPILMLTSKASELDRILGLELGADDYLTKPFSIMELMARVKAILRRIDSIQKQSRSETQTKSENKLLSVGDIHIHEDSRRVSIGERALELTAKEFELLTHFARHPDKVFRRSELLNKVWGYGHEGYEHTVNSHINRLRAKIEKDPSHPEYIVTVWGVGYKFDTHNLSTSVNL